MQKSIINFADIPIDTIRMRLKYQKKKYSVTECVKEAFRIANNKMNDLYYESTYEIQQLNNDELELYLKTV